MDRFVHDVKSGEYLLFPDLARLKIISAEAEDDLLYASVEVSMGGWSGEEPPPKPSRNIVLTDEDLRISAPADPGVVRFKFVKKNGLSGSMTITCRKTEWQAVQERIALQGASYLPLSYRGNSENFWSPKRIASTKLVDADLRELRKDQRLLSQLLLLKKWLLERTGISPADADTWLQACVDVDIPVVKVDGSFVLNVPTVPAELEYIRVLESAVAVTASNSHTRYLWSAP